HAQAAAAQPLRVLEGAQRMLPLVLRSVHLVFVQIDGKGKFGQVQVVEAVTAHALLFRFLATVGIHLRQAIAEHFVLVLGHAGCGCDANGGAIVAYLSARPAPSQAKRGLSRAGSHSTGADSTGQTSAVVDGVPASMPPGNHWPAKRPAESRQQE